MVVEVQMSQNFLLARKGWVSASIITFGFCLTLSHNISITKTLEISDSPFALICLDMINGSQSQYNISKETESLLLAGRGRRSTGYLIQALLLLIYNSVSIIFILYIASSLYINESKSMLQRSSPVI